MSNITREDLINLWNKLAETKDSSEHAKLHTSWWAMRALYDKQEKEKASSTSNTQPQGFDPSTIDLDYIKTLKSNFQSIN